MDSTLISFLTFLLAGPTHFSRHRSKSQLDEAFETVLLKFRGHQRKDRSKASHAQQNHHVHLGNRQEVSDLVEPRRNGDVELRDDAGAVEGKRFCTSASSSCMLPKPSER